MGTIPTTAAPSVTPNGGEFWLHAGRMHEIKWEGTNLKQSDHLIIR